MGNTHQYRKKATERMKYITKQTSRTGLQRIGVGAINDTDSALERMKRDGVSKISDYVATAT
ncbi:hypothetical protein H7X69_02270 [Candidatus Saccharibacteria bacterium]|nr:hypothetical protein [Candidatus Saccharibacteria bacterium]